MDAIKLLNRSAKHRLAVLRQNATLEAASVETLHRLTEVAAPLRLRKGATLWQDSDHATRVACVVHGCLLIQQMDLLGRLVYHDLKKSGALIGLEALAVDSQREVATGAPFVHQATVVAREETVVLVIPSTHFQAAMDRDPRLIRQLLQEFAKTIHRLMSEIFTERVYQGKLLLAAKLLSLAALEGAHKGRVYLPYSQLDLSRFTGLGTRNISTFITALPGIRTMSGRKGLQIEDVEALNLFLQTAQQEERSSQ
jgi:CRP-like cAMP-binding protein